MTDKTETSPPSESYSRRIKRMSWLFAFLTALIAIMTLVFILLNPANRDPKSILRLRGLFMMPVGGYLLGMALAILFAPSSFLMSLEGKKWRKQVGTRSERSTRIVAFIFAALGLVFFIGLFLAVITDEFKKPLF